MSSIEERLAALESQVGGERTIYYPRRSKTGSTQYTSGSSSGVPVMLKTKPELLNESTYSTLTTWKSVPVQSYVPRSASVVYCSLKSFIQADVVFKVRGDSTYDAQPVAYGSLQGGTVESYGVNTFIVELVNGAFEFYIDAASFAGTLYSLQLVGYG